ncbi:endonuclease III domain-containing protein, partial [Candidatus Parcubacteria bacterium]|nr:endonuclease III domain-containing protein [Candidatus Parcubacteria bacterium]
IAALHCFPKSPEALQALPGIGPYTARAVCAFAYNQDVVFVETNIRTAVIHHFFRNKNSTIYSTVSDSDIVAILEKMVPKGRTKEWYAALMDYGAHLKRSGVRLNNRAKGYRKQSAFKGSAREARGAVLRALAKGEKQRTPLLQVLGKERKGQVREEMQKLLAEGLIERKRLRYRLPR